MAGFRRLKKVHSAPALIGNSEVATSGESKPIKKRKASRQKARKQRTRNGTMEDSQNEQLSNSSSVGLATPVRRNTLAGRLANMMLMPIDIFCEVAYYLGPDDLLRLSRSSKALRGLLMAKSSKSIWKQAEKSYGLPECPQDLSPPQYASFIFDLFCSLCMNMRKFKYYVIYRVRLCQFCASTSIRSGHLLPQRNARSPITAGEWEDIYSLVPRIPPESNASRRNPTESKYYAPQLKEVYDKYLALSSTSQRRNYVRERREIVQKIVSNVFTLESWIKQNRSEDRTNCCYSVQASRRDTIHKKLRVLGYSDRDFVTYDDEENWQWKSLIDQNRELTEWIWETIRPQLEETILLRRAQKYRDLVKQRCDKLAMRTKEFIFSSPNNNCFVAAQDLFQLPVAKQIIENEDPKVDFDDTAWLTIKSQIAELSEIWKHDVETQIASMILEGRRHAEGYRTEEEQNSSSASICRHATSFFVARWDARPKVVVVDDLFDRFRYDFKETMNNYTAPFKWSLWSRVGIFNPASALVLYRSLGVTATMHDDMAALGKSFVCLCCDPILRTLMSWIELVRHFYQENLYFSERETMRQGSDSLTRIPHVNNHIVSVSVQLAAHTGISPQNSRVEDDPALTRWITICHCEQCKKNRYACTSCGECRALGGRYITFSCQEALEAHARQVHPKQPEER